MSAYGRIPFAGLDILPVGTLLQIQLALGVKNMQVHHGMQQHTAAMALATGGGGKDVALLVHYGKHLLLVVFTGCYHGIRSELSP